MAKIVENRLISNPRPQDIFILICDGWNDNHVDAEDAGYFTTAETALARAYALEERMPDKYPRGSLNWIRVSPDTEP